MTFALADRVQEITLTTGTGTLTLGGAVYGYQSFASGIASGSTCDYGILDPVTGDWEIGVGTFTAPSTLSRDSVLSSSNGNNPVNFSAGTKYVYITPSASYLAGLDNSTAVILAPTTSTRNLVQGTGDIPGLVVRATATQSAANITEISNASGTPHLTVGPTGAVLVGPVDSAFVAAYALRVVKTADLDDNTYNGIEGHSIFTGASSVNAGGYRGVLGDGRVTGSGSIAVLVGVAAQVQVKDTATATTARTIWAVQPSKDVGATIGTLVGLEVSAMTAGATNYAIRTSSGIVQLGGNLQLSTGIIYPVSDGTTAIRLMKADAATAVLTIDTSGSIVGANGEIRNTTTANASPFTQTRLTVYRDASNWGYLAYGSDAALRIVFAKTGGGAALNFGTTDAVDNTGTYTSVASLTNAGLFFTANLKLSTGFIFPNSNSTTALRLAKSDGATAVLTVDTTNNQIGIGSTPSAGGGVLVVNGEIRNTSSANATPFTQARITAYRDASNWGYVAYGNDTIMRIIYGKTGGGTLSFGTTDAADNTGTYTEKLNMTGVGVVTVKPTDAGTNTVLNSLIVLHTTSGTPAAGYGTAIDIQGHSSSNTIRDMSRWRAAWVTATDGSRAAQAILSVFDTAERDAITLIADGTGAITSLNAGVRRAVRVVTAAGAVTVTNQDQVVVVNKSSGAATTVNLPAGVTGQWFTIKDGKGDAGVNNITLTPAAGNIDGAATKVMNVNYQSIDLVYNGTEWNIV